MEAGKVRYDINILFIKTQRIWKSMHLILKQYRISTSNHRQYHPGQWKTGIISVQGRNETRVLMMAIGNALSVPGDSVRQRQNLKLMTIGDIQANFLVFLHTFVDLENPRE